MGLQLHSYLVGVVNVSGAATFSNGSKDLLALGWGSRLGSSFVSVSSRTPGMSFTTASFSLGFLSDACPPQNVSSILFLYNM